MSKTKSKSKKNSLNDNQINVFEDFDIDKYVTEGDPFEYPYLDNVRGEILQYGLARYPDLVELHEMFEKIRLMNETKSENSEEPQPTKLKESRLERNEFLYLFEPQPLFVNVQLYDDFLPSINEYPAAHHLTREQYEYKQLPEEFRSALDDSILKPIIVESHKVEAESQKFQGNLLGLIEVNEIPVLVFPSGPIMNHINLIGINHQTLKNVFQNFDESTESDAFLSTVFPSTIYQIETASNSDISEEKYIAVRGMYQCAIYSIVETTQDLELEENETNLFDLEEIKILQLESRPIHISFNQKLLPELVILCENGSVYLWDLDSGLQNIYESNKEELPWGCCEFGFHPRILFICTSKEISKFNMTTNQKEILWKVPENQNIFAFKFSPHHPFHYVITTNLSISLYDYRQTETPLLSWKHNKIEPPTQLLFHEGPSKSTILFALTTLGDVTLYHYQTPSFTGGNYIFHFHF